MLIIKFSLSSLLLLQLITLGQVAASQSSRNYISNAESALNTLQSWYNQTTGIYDTTGWWNSANCLTALGDLAAVHPKIKAKASGVFANSFVQAQNNYYPGFLNGFYDDEGWWALAWIQAYDVTNNAQYLQAAASIFEDMKNNGNTTPCGGIWWDKAETYVNAIANELYLSVGAHLANRMDNKQYYLDIAQNQWEWFKHSGMINSKYNINDGLTSNCTNNNGTVWSYNQGVILDGLVELNIASPNQSYISAAQEIATAAIVKLTDSKGILHDVCEPNCGGDGTQFKGVFSRNLQRLQQAAPEETFLSFIGANAASIWASDRNATNDELSVVWSGPFDSPADASTQSSALDALVAAAAFQSELGE